MCSLTHSILSPWKWAECEVNAIPRASSPTFCSLPPLYRDQLRRRHLELDRALFDGLSLVHPSTSPSGLALAAALKISTTTAAAKTPRHSGRRRNDRRNYGKCERSRFCWVPTATPAEVRRSAFAQLR